MFRLIRRCQQRFGVWIRRTILLLVLLVLCVMLGHGIRSRFALPDLHAWHTTKLVSEYRASDNDRPSNLAEYLALEERLFAELDEKILRNPSAEDTSYVSRYNPRTGAAAIARDTPYNRTFELRPKEGPPRGAALLLHGLTDSPYSWRATALELQEAGFYVLALRLPGHGTIPSGLLDVTAEDWKAAVAMASRHVATQIPADRPFWIGGYSTGGTLALVHALDVVERTGENSSGVLRRPDRLLLMSPAVGVSEFAVLSDLLSSVAVIPAFRKALWLDVLPEADPYKYSSFTLNAGKQVYRLTKELDRRLGHRGPATVDLPPVLSFQSLIDSTVIPKRISQRLFLSLRPNGHEMVTFDLNPGSVWFDPAVAATPKERWHRFLGATTFPYQLTILTSGSPEAPNPLAPRVAQGELAEWSLAPGSHTPTSRTLGLRWPPGLISLSHVAIPYRPDDPVYGLEPVTPPGQPLWPLGATVIRGEAGATPLGLPVFNRLRSNPFWPYMAERIDQVARADAARGTGHGPHHTSPPQ